MLSNLQNTLKTAAARAREKTRQSQTRPAAAAPATPACRRLAPPSCCRPDRRAFSTRTLADKSRDLCLEGGFLSKHASFWLVFWPPGSLGLKEKGRGTQHNPLKSIDAASASTPFLSFFKCHYYRKHSYNRSRAKRNTRTHELIAGTVCFATQKPAQHASQLAQAPPHGQISSSRLACVTMALQGADRYEFVSAGRPFSSPSVCQAAGVGSLLDLALSLCSPPHPARSATLAAATLVSPASCATG